MAEVYKSYVKFHLYLLVCGTQTRTITRYYIYVYMVAEGDCNPPTLGL